MILLLVALFLPSLQVLYVKINSNGNDWTEKEEIYTLIRLFRGFLQFCLQFFCLFFISPQSRFEDLSMEYIQFIDVHDGRFFVINIEKKDD